MRLLYRIISYLALPIVFAVVFWRGLRNRAYWDRFGERFGYTQLTIGEPSIWVHAVSVGEVQAAAPLIRALRDAYPSIPIVVTTMTPTGAQRVKDLFDDTVLHAYAPYDAPGAVRRFFDRIRPRLAVIIETELWPNLYQECGKRNVPLVLASARISPRSVSKYQRFVGLFSEALSHGIVIAAQSEPDAKRFRDLGANPARTHVVGNIKFDLEMKPEMIEAGRAWRRENAGSRPVFVAASTHEGEEQAALTAFDRLRSQFPNLLMIVVPRHPERFPLVAAQFQAGKYTFATRTSNSVCSPNTDIYLVDTLGELNQFYAAADVAFVGGSLVPVGGHNLLEPAALGLPVITGPNNFNAQEIADLFVEVGAAEIVNDPVQLAERIGAFLSDPVRQRETGERGARLVKDNRGALARVLKLIHPLIKRADGEPSIRASH